MKRLCAVVLTMCILALLFVLPSGAEGEVFVAAGNTVLPLTDAMPIRSSGVWYIDYQCFTKGNLKVSSSYNAAERTLVLYTWDTTLIFDLDTTTAYTSAEKVQYKAVSFAASDTVYVPAQFTAQMLGFEYIYLSDLPMIRIKRPSDIPNNMFIYIAKSTIPGLLETYNASKNSQSNTPSTQAPESSTPSSNNTEKKNIRLTFNITNGANLSKILDALSRYGYRATFFVQGSAVNNCEDALRRAVAYGHTLGTLSENGSADFSADSETLENALTLANERLFEVAKTKTRLVRVPDGSKTLSQDTINTLISLGYRIWDDNITPTGTTASRIYNSAVSGLLQSGRTTVTLTLSDSDTAVNALTRILRYLNTNKYSTYTITLLDTPVNDISEKR